MLSSPPHCGLSLQTLTILMDLARTTVLAQIEGDFKYKAIFIFQRIHRKISKFHLLQPQPPKALPSHDGLTPVQLLIQGLFKHRAWTDCSSWGCPQVDPDGRANGQERGTDGLLSCKPSKQHGRPQTSTLLQTPEWNRSGLLPASGWLVQKAQHLNVVFKQGHTVNPRLTKTGVRRCGALYLTFCLLTKLHRNVTEYYWSSSSTFCTSYSFTVLPPTAEQLWFYITPWICTLQIQIFNLCGKPVIILSLVTDFLFPSFPFRSVTFA